MAESDVKLVVGIDLAASRKEIKGGIANIQSFVEGKKLKIKVELDKKNGTSIGQQITSAIKNVNAAGLPPLKISEIKIAPSAISGLKAELDSAFKSLTGNKDLSISINTKSQQEIDEMVRKAGEYRTQIEKFNQQNKELKSQMTGLGKGSTEEEVAAIDRVIAKYNEWRSVVNEIEARKKVTGSEAVDKESVEIADAYKESVNEAIESARKLQEKNKELAESEAKAAEETKRAADEKAAANKRSAENAEAQVRQSEQLAQAEQKRQSLLKQSADLMTRLRSAEDNWTKSKFGKTSNEYSQISGYIEQLQKLDAAFKGGSMTPGQYSMQLKQISAEFARTSSVIKSAGENTGSFFDRIGNITSKFASWLSVSRIIMEVYQGIKKMISASIELESAFARIQIVTGATDSQMSQFATTTANLAQDLGKSITDVAKTIETFSRLGYDLPDASELAKFASVLSNVADVGLEEATTGLTSIIKGFGMDVSNASHVADVLTEVGQKYAVSASEMMEAYEKSGAALNATGTSFEKSAGLIAAANAAVSLCRAA